MELITPLTYESLSERQLNGLDPINNNLILNVDKLPNNLKLIVHGNLIINKIKVMPKFGGTIYGDLTLTDTQYFRGKFYPTIMGNLNVTSLVEFNEKYKPTIYGSLIVSKNVDIPYYVHNSYRLSCLRSSKSIKI